MRYLVTRVQTVLDRSDTEVQVGFRKVSEETASGAGNPYSTRSYSVIDFLVAQRLGFLENLSRSEWRILLAYQDVTTEDELTETGAGSGLEPTSTYSRLSGGIEIRF